MSARSLNKVTLIGNLTRDPELRYTPSGAAVCTFGLATNRSWTTQSGETKEETEFHRIVVWNKLAELCAQLLVKGRKVYVEGRLSTRSWTAPDGTQRTSTEIVIEDMIILDSKRVIKEEDPSAGAVSSLPKAVVTPAAVTPADSATVVTAEPEKSKSDESKPKKVKKQDSDKADTAKEEKPVKEVTNEDITPDDIPF